ncbi:MAG: hypothetical protein ACREDV_03025 [Methylocella sp.]
MVVSPRGAGRGGLEKTGCNRQAGIVALLTALSATRLPHPA